MPIVDNNVRKIIGSSVRDRIKKRIRENRVKPKTNKRGGTTLVESRRLANSINYQINGDRIPVGTNLIYAKIQHEGGIITPKKAKYLAIPLTPAAKAMRPRDFTDTFINKGVIFRKLEGGKIEALYALKKQVKIPARPYMFIDNEDINFIKQRLRNYWRTNDKIF